MPRANAEGIPIIKLLLLFQLQQILLHLHAIGVAGELAGAAHHPVAGLKDGDGVAVAGTAHGTAGLGFANSGDRKSTRLNSSHSRLSRMPSSA